MPGNFQIRITCETSKPKVSLPKIKRAAEQILKKIGWKKAGLSVILTSDRKIQKINKLHLKHDRPTDVISFSQLEGRRIHYPSGQAPFLGDLVISLETTARQAQIYGNSFSYELAFYLCHGILHLMGHDDSTKAQAKKMETMQRKILQKILKQKGAKFLSFERESSS